MGVNGLIVEGGVWGQGRRNMNQGMEVVMYGGERMTRRKLMFGLALLSRPD